MSTISSDNASSNSSDCADIVGCDGIDLPFLEDKGSSMSLFARTHDGLYDALMATAAGADFQDEQVLAQSQDQLPIFLQLLKTSHSTPASIKDRLFLDDLC
eukprot:TRINITY_DN36562_c0_g1_i1.p1 TRINITY_DN36562_c0_g1~~TRINITY_DN36562_c0_g1_i1.p1  ORF type:complete len:101 (-),score=22.38 TRINITY_DN36562_c0_g1_i1:185-487(-)